MMADEVLRLLLLVLLVPAAASSAELHGEAAVDFHFGLSRRWDLLVRNRARVRSTQNDWYEASLVPVFGFQWKPELRLAAGAYYSRLESSPGSWRHRLRPLVAVEPTLISRSVTLSLRTQYERVVIAGTSDFNRYRQRFRVSGGRRWAAHGGLELFFTNHGYATTRYGAGLRRSVGQRDAVEFGYWYETRRLIDHGIRHMLYTSFTFDFADPARGDSGKTGRRAVE